VGAFGSTVKTKKLKKLEGESNKWAKMMEVPAGGMKA
jgi:hypothetical protein